MMTEQDKVIIKYLAELAVTNPQQLPLAMLELMKQRLVLAVTNHLREVVEASLNDFEKQLKKALDISTDEEDH